MWHSNITIFYANMHVVKYFFDCEILDFLINAYFKFQKHLLFFKGESSPFKFSKNVNRFQQSSMPLCMYVCACPQISEKNVHKNAIIIQFHVNHAYA